MKEYFKIIRKALEESRTKGGDAYYEAHHIIPKCFGKKSSTVLLTPEEHYKAHMLLAVYWKDHKIYGQKMIWAFHRMTYDGKRLITQEEYAEARRLIMPLWTRKKSTSHKEKITAARRGKKSIVHPHSKEIKYVESAELHKWIEKGWENTNYKKGQKCVLSEQGRRGIASARKRDQVGKVGLEARAAKGPYTVVYSSGEQVTAGSYPELSKQTGIPFITLQWRFVHKKGVFIKGWKIE